MSILELQNSPLASVYLGEFSVDFSQPAIPSATWMHSSSDPGSWNGHNSGKWRQAVV